MHTYATKDAMHTPTPRRCACSASSPPCAACHAHRPQVAPSVVDVVRSRGDALDAGMRAAFAPRVGFDLSTVRIHHDAAADASARTMGAAAYTIGSHVAFARGRYAPTTGAGRQLLAHELTHVAQQRAAGLGADVRSAEQIALVPADHASERAAHGVAAGGGMAVAPLAAPAAGRAVLQRAPDPPPLIPPIPAPLDLRLDPVVQIDDPSLPAVLRQPLKLSDLEKALDALGLRSGPSPSTLCESYGNGFSTDQSKDAFKGQCCQGTMRDANHCCPPKKIGFAGVDVRCARPGEVVLPNKQIVKPAPAVLPPTVLTPPQAVTPAPAPAQPAPAVAAATHVLIDRFAVDGRTVPPSAEPKLDALAAQLLAAGDAPVHIDGHTDSTYTDAYNQTLSEDRANAVKAGLVRRGIAATRMVVAGYGERNPRAVEKTADDRALNRRVDVWFTAPAPATAPGPSATPAKP